MTSMSTKYVNNMPVTLLQQCYSDFGIQVDGLVNVVFRYEDNLLSEKWRRTDVPKCLPKRLSVKQLGRNAM